MYSESIYFLGSVLSEAMSQALPPSIPHHFLSVLCLPGRGHDLTTHQPCPISSVKQVSLLGSWFTFEPFLVPPSCPDPPWTFWHFPIPVPGLVMSLVPSSPLVGGWNGLGGGQSHSFVKTGLGDWSSVSGSLT